MILKSLSRKSNSSQLIRYVCRYILAPEKRIDQIKDKNAIQEHPALIIKHNIRSRTINGFIKSFETHEKFRIIKRKDSVKLFHTIISFSPEDRAYINEELLKDISNKFIELRGEDNIYLITPHWNESVHLHCVYSGVLLNGRSARISNQKFRSLKRSLEAYQREHYPELIHSRIEHDKGLRLTKEAAINTFKLSHQSNKISLLECLEKAFANATSKIEFINQLQKFGHDLYYRNGKLQGVLFNGKTKYRFNRLNFDRERIENLDISKKKELQELMSLRKGKQHSLRKASRLIETKQEIGNNLNEKEQTLLTEISAIREKNSIIQEHETGIEINSSEAESGSSENGEAGNGDSEGGESD